MAQKLTFTKVSLLSCLRKPTGGVAKFSAALTKTVIGKMEWGDFPDWQKTGTPAGRLAASVVELTPKDEILAKHAIELATTLVDSFEIARIESKGKTAKKTKSSHTDLTFSVHFSDQAGARKLEAYMQTCGESTLTVTYEKEAEQEELPGTGDAEATGELQEAVQDAKRRRATSKEED